MGYCFNEQEFNNLGVILKLFLSLKFSNLSNTIYLDGNKIYTCEVIMGGIASYRGNNISIIKYSMHKLIDYRQA